MTPHRSSQLATYTCIRPNQKARVLNQASIFGKIQLQASSQLASQTKTYGLGNIHTRTGTTEGGYHQMQYFHSVEHLVKITKKRVRVSILFMYHTNSGYLCFPVVTVHNQVQKCINYMYIIYSLFTLQSDIE